MTYEKWVYLKETNIEWFEEERSYKNYLAYRRAVEQSDVNLARLLECPSAIESIETEKFIDAARNGNLEYVKLHNFEKNQKAGNYQAFTASVINGHKNLCDFLFCLPAHQAYLERYFKHSYIGYYCNNETFKTYIVDKLFELNTLDKLAKIADSEQHFDQYAIIQERIKYLTKTP